MNKNDIKVIIGSSIISIFLGAAGGAAISEYRHNNLRYDGSCTPVETDMDFTSPEHTPI